jgi:hypothetical protein
MKFRFTKIAIFLAALIPLERLLWKAFHDGLGANPIEVITHSTGDWTLILVLTTLSITPLRRITRQYWLIGLRRMIGLFAFFYGTLHFLTYIWLDKFFDVHEMLKDIAKRPFITVGFSAFVLMIPLALTSTAWSIRRWAGRTGSAAPPDLSHGNSGGYSLHLAGEGRSPQAHRVRNRAPSCFLPRGILDVGEAQATRIFSSGASASRQSLECRLKDISLRSRRAWHPGNAFVIFFLETFS